MLSGILHRFLSLAWKLQWEHFANHFHESLQKSSQVGRWFERQGSNSYSRHVHLRNAAPPCSHAHSTAVRWEWCIARSIQTGLWVVLFCKRMASNCSAIKWAERIIINMSGCSAEQILLGANKNCTPDISGNPKTDCKRKTKLLSLDRGMQGFCDWPRLLWSDLESRKNGSSTFKSYLGVSCSRVACLSQCSLWTASFGATNFSVPQVLFKLQHSKITVNSFNFLQQRCQEKWKIKLAALCFCYSLRASNSELTS